LRGDSQSSRRQEAVPFHCKIISSAHFRVCVCARARLRTRVCACALRRSPCRSRRRRQGLWCGGKASSRATARPWTLRPCPTATPPPRRSLGGHCARGCTRCCRSCSGPKPHRVCRRTRRCTLDSAGPCSLDAATHCAHM
jgi:hypothetical protein